MSQRAERDVHYPVSSLCGLLGISRQGYYRHSQKKEETDILISSIVIYCIHARKELPSSGCRELYHLCRAYFGEKFTLGRDRFYDVLRSNSLMLKKKRFRPRTTDSRHPYRIYSDLLNTSPKFVAQENCRMVVADITYVLTKEGFAYLSLLTDAYSRAIVGYALSRTLETNGPLKALKCALEFYDSYHFQVRNLIHHSDRGVQYASKEYVATLKQNGISISMTQTGDPLHNALAERMNNTIKNGWLFEYEDCTFEETCRGVDRAVYNYNWMRPHQAIGMKTPIQMVCQEVTNPLLSVTNIDGII